MKFEQVTILSDILWESLSSHSKPLSIDDIDDIIKDNYISFVARTFNNTYFFSFPLLEQQNSDIVRKELYTELDCLLECSDKYFFRRCQRRSLGRRYRGFEINIILLSDILFKKYFNYNDKDTLENIANRESDSDYRIFRGNVLARDNYKCQCCGLKKKLHVHHIFSYKYYPSLRTDVNNGITLCKYCHQKYHTIYGNKHGVNAGTFSKFMRDFGIR